MTFGIYLPPAALRGFRMEDYVVQELPDLVERRFETSSGRDISGHSMGGHGSAGAGRDAASARR
jgi:S-formylglutathione hydrolase FrmB